MIISATAFTQRGYEVINQLEADMPEVLFSVRKKDTDLNTWAEASFYKHIPIVFVGAIGIAVRTIAPFVKDKLMDSPVIVIDEKAEYVIPVLSGHIGAANEIATILAKVLKATPVITTATDVERLFSVDVFARRNYLSIENRDGIRGFSSKILNNEKAYLFIRGDYLLEDKLIPDNVEISCDKKCADIELVPKKYVLGIGCKKGKSFEELKEFVEKHLELKKIDIKDVAAITSIDLKKKEEGLNILACYLHIPFITYSAEKLSLAELEQGEFCESDFVKNVTGVSNVCERAAMSFDRANSLIVKKISENGMTLAVAGLEGKITTWET